MGRGGHPLLSRDLLHTLSGCDNQPVPVISRSATAASSAFLKVLPRPFCRDASAAKIVRRPARLKKFSVIGTTLSLMFACWWSVVHIEGTDKAYSASGAMTMTITYDEKSLPAKVLFHDANHRSLCIILRRDNAGRLLSEEQHQGERSPFQDIVDQAPPGSASKWLPASSKCQGRQISSATYA